MAVLCDLLPAAFIPLSAAFPGPDEMRMKVCLVCESILAAAFLLPQLISHGKRKLQFSAALFRHIPISMLRFILFPAFAAVIWMLCGAGGQNGSSPFFLGAMKNLLLQDA